MYKKLRNTIDKLKLIDNHAHPGFAEYFESLPEENRVSFAVDNYKTPRESSPFPYLRDLHYEAYEKLYGFSRKEINNSEKKKDLAKKYEKRRYQLQNLVDDAMEAAGVETLIANFVLPDSIKQSEKMKFIPVMDPIFFPFNNEYLKERVLGASFIGSYEYMLAELKRKHNYKEEGFEGYLKFIDKVSKDYLDQGVVGFKLALPYVRNSYFEKIDAKKGYYLYEKAKKGDLEAYQKLQDLLVWYFMKKTVKYEMPVQIHFAITDHYVEYFDPMNLSNMLQDKELQDAKIVILHAGYPRYKRAGLMALGGLKPNNVYIDISGRVMFDNHPKIIAKMLRDWLELPALWDKIIYGSDAVWGERYIYTAAQTARDAVYYALESIIDDGILGEEKAIVLAKKILRENALELYELK